MEHIFAPSTYLLEEVQVRLDKIKVLVAQMKSNLFCESGLLQIGREYDILHEEVEVVMTEIKIANAMPRETKSSLKIAKKAFIHSERYFFLQSSKVADH